MTKPLSLLALIVALALVHHALGAGGEGRQADGASGLSVAAALSPCAGSAPAPPSP